MNIFIGGIIVYIAVKEGIDRLYDKTVYHPYPMKGDSKILLQQYETICKKEINEEVKLHEIYNYPNKDIIINTVILTNPKSDKWIVFAHGNAGNIYDRLHTLLWMGKIANVVMFDYRGFGKSNGSPSESGLYADILCVYNHLIKSGIKRDKVTLYGESLGCSPVAWLGSKIGHQINGIVMQSGFSSIKDIAEEKIGYASSFVGNEYNSTNHIKNVKCKILIAHSPDDDIIPYSHVDKLMNMNNRCELFKLSGSHNNPNIDDNYINLLKSFI